MAIDSILAQIDAEIAKLTQVRSLLANTGKIADKITERLTKKVGRPAKVQGCQSRKGSQGCQGHQDQEAPLTQP
jgi:hypothetical protein